MRKKIYPACAKCHDPNKTVADFYASNHTWCKTCRSNYQKEHPPKHTPYQDWKLYIKRNYNITEQDYSAMLKEQGGVCASCGKEETTFDKRTNSFRKLAIDHCHTTDAVRGLLCSGCNQALGYLREDPGKIKALLKYVEERCQW